MDGSSVIGSRSGLVVAGALAAGVTVGVALAWLPTLLEELLMPVPVRNFITLLRSNNTSLALHVFARLGLADVLTEGPPEGMTAEQLVTKTPAHAPTLFRVLRFLTSLDHAVISVDKHKRFKLTRFGRFFTTSHPMSCKNLTLTWQFPFTQKARNEMFNSVQTGKPGYRLAWGSQHVSGWDVMHGLDQQNGTDSGQSRMTGPCIDVPSEIGIFDETMGNMSRQMAPMIAGSFPWSKFKVVADVGGANGTLMKAVLARHSGVQALVLDLPQVIDKLQLPAGNDVPGLSFVKGDFFKPLPAALSGADAVVLKYILHDWSDEEAAVILGNVRGCLAPGGGKLILLESIVPPLPCGQSALPVLAMDLEMMNWNGRERTKEEWDTMLAAAGFKLESIKLLAGSLNILVAGLA